MLPFGSDQTKSKRKKNKRGGGPLIEKEMAAETPRNLTFLKGLLYFVSVCQPENKYAETASVEAYRSIKN